MKTISYNTTGTCCKRIDVSVNDDGRIDNVKFIGGCNGNLQGVASLVQGMEVSEVIKRLDGLICGNKGTSCPDQLCRALEFAMK